MRHDVCEGTQPLSRAQQSTLLLVIHPQAEIRSSTDNMVLVDHHYAFTCAAIVPVSSACASSTAIPLIHPYRSRDCTAKLVWFLLATTHLHTHALDLNDFSRAVALLLSFDKCLP